MAEHPRDSRVCGGYRDPPGHKGLTVEGVWMRREEASSSPEEPFGTDSEMNRQIKK